MRGLRVMFLTEVQVMARREASEKRENYLLAFPVDSHVQQQLFGNRDSLQCSYYRQI